MTEVLLYSGLSILIFMNLMFFLALALKDNSIVDVGWGIGFITVAITSLWSSHNSSYEALLLAALVLIWGLRLAGYIAKRNRGKGEDYRYKQWREEWGKNVVWRSYLQVFMLQGGIMFLVALPIMIGILNGVDDLGLTEIAGTLLWLVGFFFEAVGDYQMYRFKKEPANKGKVMKYGLWKYTRHPNYFGEAVMWWGIFLIAANNGYIYLSLISPVLLTFLLLKVSGVAMLERKYDDNPEYQQYIESTSAFIPLPPKKNT